MSNQKCVIIRKHVSGHGKLYTPGEIVPAEKFDEIHRLVANGAVEPCEGLVLPPKPPTIEEAQEVVEDLHKRLLDTETALERATATTVDADGTLKRTIDDLRKEIEAAYESHKAMEAGRIAEKNRADRAEASLAEANAEVEKLKGQLLQQMQQAQPQPAEPEAKGGKKAK